MAERDYASAMSEHEHGAPVTVCLHVAAGAPPVPMPETGTDATSPAARKLCGTCGDLRRRLQGSGDAFPDDLLVAVCPQCLEESQRGRG